MRKLIGVLLVFCLLSGCSSDPQKRSAGEGGAIGGLGAAVICKLAGGSDGTCAAVGIAGAAAGAAIGYQYAGNIQKRRQQLAGRENDLDARIEYVRGLNEDTEKFNQRLSGQVVTVENQIKQGRLSQAKLVQTREALDKEVQAAGTQLKAANKELDDMKRFRAQQVARNSPELDREITRLESLLAEAQQNTTALASLRQRI